MKNGFRDFYAVPTPVYIIHFYFFPKLWAPLKMVQVWCVVGFSLKRKEIKGSGT